MTYFSLAFSLACLSTNSFAFEILALGTSNTNCKGANQAYTKTLNELLENDGIKATVINAGKDGDTPQFMIRRMSSLLNPSTKLVIFEPGPNERNKDRNLADSEKILEDLQRKRVPTIYVSHRLIETEQDALARAQKFGAIHYGHWDKNVPTDREHHQYDQPNRAGHMSETGCRRWANNIFPLIKKVIADNGLGK